MGTRLPNGRERLIGLRATRGPIPQVRIFEIAGSAMPAYTNPPCLIPLPVRIEIATHSIFVARAMSH